MPESLNFKRDRFCQKDQLGFDQYIDVLADMIREQNFQTPFTIGLYGKWGSGKTSFMRLLEKKLQEDGGDPPRPITVWFNPWRYEKEEHLIIPFLKTLEQAIYRYCEVQEEKTIGTELVAQLKKGAGKIGRAAVAFAYGMTLDCKLAGTGFSFDAAKAAGREEELTRQRAEETRRYSESLSSIYYDIIGELKQAVDKDKFRIVAFIDDLDRCLPEKALELLESIKLFLDLEGYLFLLGVDREVVEQGIAYRYRFYEKESEKWAEGQEKNKPAKRIISPADYLDKMIQLPFELPPMEPTLKRQFIESLLEKSGYKDEAPLIEAGIGDNPRSLTRFVNFLAFMGRLAQKLKEKIPTEIYDPGRPENFQELLDRYFTPHFYVKWAIIVFRFRAEHDKIKNRSSYLIDLQDAAGGSKERIEEWSEAGKKLPPPAGAPLLPESLRKVLAMGKPFPNEPWLIRKFIHLAAAVEVATRETGEESAPQIVGRDQQKMPAIGTMVHVPHGPFLYGGFKEQANIDEDFEIDVYPVTNGQYKEFVDEDGYENDQWWSKEGLAWRKKYKVTAPYYWSDEKWNQEDYPVVGVNYYEAKAYAAWAGKRLPTEQEWEKAARGDNGLVYPWGDEFDPEKFNIEAFEKGCTTPVTAYPAGVSPYDCFDMAGNVWEWTDSWYDKDEEAKVLRGGSWFDSRVNARCMARTSGDPRYRDYRLNYVGFRCARTVK